MEDKPDVKFVRMHTQQNTEKRSDQIIGIQLMVTLATQKTGSILQITEEQIKI